MADEQPTNTPSEDVPSSDAQASSPDSDKPEGQSSAPPWWRRMFSRRGDEETTDESADSDKASTSSPAVTLTQEELDRRVQAETDRREARRLQAERVKARRELRDQDPWQYAEQERKEEEAAMSGAQVQQFLSNVGVEHDRVAIDPLFFALPKSEQERIQKLEGAGQGLVGRKLVVTESLKALEKHWKAEGQKEAERKLRANPSFRKQVLAESRGQTVEPDLVPALSGSEADQTVSGLLRGYYGLRHNEAS